MKKTAILLALVFGAYIADAQKKPLDHSVYDSWQHIGERMISNDGKWIVYTIEPQEGDNELIIQSSAQVYPGKEDYRKVIPRGYSALITEDSRFVIFKIKPFYKDTRQARIKKKKPEEMPKDSLGIVELGNEMIWKTARVKSYKTPQRSYNWVAYQLEKKPEPPAKRNAEPAANKNISDSLQRVIDSLQDIIQAIPERRKRARDEDDQQSEEATDFADGDDSSPASVDSGSDLVIRNLSAGESITVNNVVEYYFAKDKGRLLVKKAKNPADSLSKPMIVLYELGAGGNNIKTKVLSEGGNDFKNFVIADDGSQCAWLAERDSKPKDLQRFYKLWYFKDGMDSAKMIVDKNTSNMQAGMTVSEYSTLNFSRAGTRLFFGVAPVAAPRDTNFVEFDHPKVDIWHYNDDYLQTVQNFPARLRAAQQENFLTVYDLSTERMQQLGSKRIPQVLQTDEGNGKIFVGVTDFGKRIASQWQGTTLKDIYAINVETGDTQLIRKDLLGQVYPSSTGKYIMWYDRTARNYFTWDGSAIKNITEKIKSPLWNEEWDTPDEPNNYGIMAWEENDAAVYIYDRYKIWKADPSGLTEPSIFKQYTDDKHKKVTVRYIRTNPDERAVSRKQPMLFRAFDNDNKDMTLFTENWNDLLVVPIFRPVSIGNIITSRKANVLAYTTESFEKPADLRVYKLTSKTEAANAINIDYNETRLSAINPQQSLYNWGTSELFHWKAYNGKDATGIVYKPEDFDPKKKYPMIVYFYEKISDSLHDYKEPAPIRSAVNIPFFVSRGYIIFIPDISYTTGHPGKNAYDYIVSGSRALVKQGFVDSTNMALQGHSWGGYQAAQLATMTKLYKAVWAGAPVANMTSAYGGIRWESGVSRQFQYEKTQSRIGGTLWEKLPLYLENSPLFHLEKVTAPMVIMANDADGAVPWYQGIELFSGLRRLGKKVWMFNYNGQGHGLTQRQDMRDYQIRMQQFFDWILKGDKPARWITDGVPAVNKGKDWGID